MDPQTSSGSPEPARGHRRSRAAPPCPAASPQEPLSRSAGRVWGWFRYFLAFLKRNWVSPRCGGERGRAGRAPAFAFGIQNEAASINPTSLVVANMKRAPTLRRSTHPSGEGGCEPPHAALVPTASFRRKKMERSGFFSPKSPWGGSRPPNPPSREGLGEQRGGGQAAIKPLWNSLARGFNEVSLRDGSQRWDGKRSPGSILDTPSPMHPPPMHTPLSQGAP